MGSITSKITDKQENTFDDDRFNRNKFYAV